MRSIEKQHKNLDYARIKSDYITNQIWSSKYCMEDKDTMIAIINARYNEDAWKRYCDADTAVREMLMDIIEKALYCKSETEAIQEKQYSVDEPVKRPVWKNHEIIGYVTISLEGKDFLNGIKDAGFYLGFTDEEHEILNYGSEENLIDAGFLK